MTATGSTTSSFRGSRALVVALLAAVLTLLAGQPAGAHVPALRGRLVDLVRRADLVVIGITNHVRLVGNRITCGP